MTQLVRIGLGSVVLGLVMTSMGCVVQARPDYYYDHDHHRYWHENGWHDCGESNDRCR